MKKYRRPVIRTGEKHPRNGGWSHELFFGRSLVGEGVGTSTQSGKIKMANKTVKMVLLIVLVFGSIYAQERFIGSPAPDFSAPDVSSPVGKTYVLSKNFAKDSTSRAVVICFFGSWCDLCRQELSLMRSLCDSLYKDKLTMVAVCLDKAWGPKPQLLAKSAGLTCTVMLDPQRSIARQYHMKGQLPYSVIIDKNGTVFSTVSGYSPRAERYILLKLDVMMKNFRETKMRR
jgi:peroxiredoxin